LGPGHAQFLLRWRSGPQSVGRHRSVLTLCLLPILYKEKGYSHGGAIILLFRPKRSSSWTSIKPCQSWNHGSRSSRSGRVRITEMTLIRAIEPLLTNWWNWPTAGTIRLMLCSDGPVWSVLIKKIVQEGREDRSEDQPQDPDRLGVHLQCTWNDYEASKSDNACYSTHDESNKHADDNLLHDISFFSLRPFPKAEPLPWFASHWPRPF